MQKRENEGFMRCERDTSCVCFGARVSTHTHLTGAHLLGYGIQCPTDGTFKVTVSDTQISREVKVQFSERNQHLKKLPF